MSGIVIDAYKLRKQSQIVKAKIKKLHSLYPGLAPKELKTSRMLNGRDRWSKVDANVRKQFVSDLCDLISGTAKVISIVIDFDKFQANKSMFGFCGNSYWIASGAY